MPPSGIFSVASYSRRPSDCMTRMVYSASSEPATSWMYRTAPLRFVWVRKSALAESPERFTTISGGNSESAVSHRKFLPAALWAWVEGWMGLPERAETAQIKASFLAANSPTCPSLFMSTAAREEPAICEHLHGPLVPIAAGLRRPVGSLRLFLLRSFLLFEHRGQCLAQGSDGQLELGGHVMQRGVPLALVFEFQ